MKYILFILLTALAACQPSIATNTTDAPPPTAMAMTDSYEPTIPDTAWLHGDFNGDSIPDTAYSILLKARVDAETQDEYTIRFTTQDIPDLYAGEGDLRLINEGDLNNDGRDDISIFRKPGNGCTYDMQPWSFTNGKWKAISDMILVPTFCDYMSDSAVQARIVNVDSTLFFYEPDYNIDITKLVRKRLPLL
ncbi:hypothetical protein F0L74_10820 [Chitinophaga agrisoli]|uniref:VCBS repeat protein n=1 Tax=Chitinophaga agrisoli TaxID=2607653 RepID=A0A5B2VVB3_9BACT|nr:hypothetical protein [Chitinophaga agrisoli]KAA2243005.1 hypothetical protein F0L74_10820 [Chitinophaga agrisoli]